MRSCLDVLLKTIGNLVIKYDLRQMRPDGKSMYSKVESILKQAAAENQILVNLEFEAIEEKKKQQIIKKVTTECKSALSEPYMMILTE